jgi:hypothetical protein
MASCTSVHVAESIGLHRNICENRAKRALLQFFSASDKDLRKRTFWVAISLNQFLSAEYGRSRIHLDLIDCKLFEDRQEDFTTRTINLMQSVPGKIINGDSVLDSLSALDKALDFQANSPFLGLLRADVCFCNFRIIRSKNISLTETQVTSVLEVIRVAMDGVKFLMTMKQPWWNVVGTPFHAVCVLLSIRTAAGFAILPDVVGTLRSIVAEYDSHLSREALRTAIDLIQGAKAKVTGELDSLNHSLGTFRDVSPASTGRMTPIDVAWAFGDGLGFSDFLDFSSTIDASGPSVMP